MKTKSYDREILEVTSVSILLKIPFSIKPDLLFQAITTLNKIIKTDPISRTYSGLKLLSTISGAILLIPDDSGLFIPHILGLFHKKTPAASA